MVRQLAISLFLLVAATHAQLICSFETPEECALVKGAGARTEVVAEHATHGAKALQAVFPGSEQDSWPGVSFRPSPNLLLGKDQLVFDVYNPGTAPVQLSWRIDDANGKKVFGGAQLKPGATTVDIYLQALGDQLTLAQVTQFYLYLRMPRQDTTLVFDQFRVQNFADSFIPLTYRQSGPIATPAPADRARGYQLFARHWLDLVFPTSRPLPGETDVRLDAFATPGEAEPLVFSVLALRELTSAQVTASDLVAPDGSRIPADALTVYPVRCLDKRTTYSSKEFIRDLPVLLERRASVTIPADAAKRFWLDLRVPADAAPGVYTGQATFTAAGVPETTVPIRVRVLPFSLPEPTDRYFGEYYQGPRLATTPEEERAFLERDLRDMRANGMTSVGLCFGIPTAGATFAEGKVRLDLPGDDRFVHFMDLYRDLGFPVPIVILSDSGQGFAAKEKVAFGSPEYKERYQAFWRAVQEESKARGWAELIVQPVDEPGWKDQEAKDRNATLLRWLKEIPGMRTEQDGPGDGYFLGVAGPHADMWNYNGAIGKEAEVAAAKAKGHLIAIYNCDVESYRPEAQRYVAGFYLQRAGIHGCYNWAYMSFSGSPYSDFDFRTGTWMHVYPAWKDEVGGPSIGWLGFREGIDDYRYLLAFEQAAARADREGDAQAKQAVAAGRQRLAALLSTLTYSPAVRNAPRFASKRPVEGGFAVTGPLKIANGWDFATYDMARWQVAEATLALVAPQPPAPVVADQPAELLVRPTWTERSVERATPLVAARQISIPLIEDQVTVDGDLSEPAWAKASPIGDFALVSGGEPQAQTRAWLFRTSESLCLGVECDEPFTSMLTAGIAQDGGEVWKDDCIELFLDPKLDRSTFRQLVVNSLGKVLAVDSTGAKWQPKVKVAAKVMADRWRVELVLPLEDIQATATTFGFNLCRERRPTEVFELSCWSPTGGRFGEPSRFGIASLGASFFQSVTLGPGMVGANPLLANVANATDTAMQVRLVALTTQGKEPATRSQSAPTTLAPGATATLTVPYALDNREGPVGVQAILEDAQTGKPLAEQRLSQALVAPLAVHVSPALSFTSQSILTCTVEIATAPALRPGLSLAMELVDDATGQTVSRGRVPTVSGEVLTAELHLSSAPGSFQLRTTLTQAEGTVLAHSEVPVSRVAGPF